MEWSISYPVLDGFEKAFANTKTNVFHFFHCWQNP